MSGEDSRLRGRWGEALAAEFLRRKGYRIIAAGWRCRFGELDLVAERGEFLCFIEVKLRRSGRFGTGAEQVDRRKQERLRTTAELYLQQHPSPLQPRFDVVEILAPQGMATKRPGIRQIENAF
ncbi:MAG: YraN family protein [Oscillospiraceae bacterium]|nr:YraN family protein [Oscillospiraceae bacterium]